MEFTVENGLAFTIINGVKGTLNKYDTDQLIEHAKAINSGIYVETGSYLGCSSIIIAEANPNIKVYAHDIWVDDWKLLPVSTGPPPEVSNYYEQFLKNTHNYSSIIPIKGDSPFTIINTHTDNTIDLAFIDGDHSYKGCLYDCVAIYPKMKKKSVILVHDCNQGSPCLKAVIDFCNKYGLIYNHLPNTCGMVKIIT